MTEPDQSANTQDSESNTRSKLAKLIQRYGLTGLGDELVEYWTRETDDRKSLRELADFVNEELIAKLLQDASQTMLAGEAANYYRLLTADDISSGMRIQAENQLERHGVDVEQLREDFVSRQAIHTYLTQERDATYDRSGPSDNERIDASIDTIGRIKNRLVAVAERSLSELAGSSRLSSGETRVTVLVQVQCLHCDTQYPITEFLKNGGCDCRSSNQ